jgi:hypothetical protein
MRGLQVAFLSVLSVFSPSQKFSDSVDTTSHARRSKLITPAISDYIEDVRTSSNVHGLSVSVVSLDEGVEWGGWGEKTEEGDPVTGEVRLLAISYAE